VIRFSKKYIHKSWDWEDLFSNKNEIIERCKKIEYLSHEVDSIPNTVFKFNSLNIYQKQDRIINTISISNCFNKKKIYDLLKDLDFIHFNKLIHWDLCPRNIIWSKLDNQYFIIDWEPDFIQRRFGKKTFIAVKDYIHPDERTYPSLYSTLSDKFAILKCIYKSKNSDLNFKNIDFNQLKCKDFNQFL